MIFLNVHWIMHFDIYYVYVLLSETDNLTLEPQMIIQDTIDGYYKSIRRSIRW